MKPIAQTMLDKLWTAHEVLRREDGVSLLWIDRHLVHEGSHHAFAKLKERGLSVCEPDLTFAFVDHYAPTRRSSQTCDPQILGMIQTLRQNAHDHGVRLYDLDDPRQGIAHVVGPEEGLTLPGLLINCGDSHTSTHGAFGALAFGIGATEVAHVLATQTIWQRKPKSMRIRVEGALGFGVSAKDIALGWIGKLGTDGAQGHAVEYAGAVIRGLSMEGRMTLCNMAIEAGARAGMIAVDETTLEYVKDRPMAPKGAQWAKAKAYWQTLHSDGDAVFDRELRLDASKIEPQVTWGTSPEMVSSINGRVPSQENLPDETSKKSLARALEYMGLEEGMALTDIEVDMVFIGSCTNARIEDMRVAASIVQGRCKAANVERVLVVPGSGLVKAQAEAEGLDKIFEAAGMEWRAPGCSMCLAMNADKLAPGKRCASTSNRNFEGRQGSGGRTHLVSPAMAATAAVAGRFVHPSTLEV